MRNGRRGGTRRSGGMADATVLNTVGLCPCGFESHLRHVVIRRQKPDHDPVVVELPVQGLVRQNEAGKREMADRTLGTLIVWAADIGSVVRGRFAWCRMESEGVVTSGSDILALAEGVADDLAASRQVALGFECPLYVPVAREPEALSRGREVDGNRPWSASVGSTVLALGLVETAWVFSRLAEVTTVPVLPTFRWTEFTAGRANLFIWEAFVTGSAKGASHEDDAKIAAASFWQRYPDIEEADGQRDDRPLSMAGAALLHSGLVTDIALLSEACVVIRS
jgi:hypothetical protein